DRIQDSRNILRLAKLVSLPTPNTPVCMRPRYSALGSLARSAPHRAQSPVPHSWLAAVQARSGCPNRTQHQLQACRSLIWYSTRLGAARSPAGGSRLPVASASSRLRFPYRRTSPSTGVGLLP